MHKKAQSFSIGMVFTVLLLSIMGFGIYSGIQSMGEENINTIEESFKNNNITLQRKGIAGASFFISQNAVTPSLMKDWLPPKGKYIFILEDLPLLDGTDFIIIIPFLLLAIWICKYIDTDSAFKNFLFKALLIIGFVVFGYVLWKVFMLWLYYWSGQTLGISKEILINFRIGVNNAIGKYTGLLTVLTLAGAIGIFKMIFGKGD